MKRYLFALLSFYLSFACCGQSMETDSLMWSASKATSQIDNSEIIYTCRFKTTPGLSVDWIQSDGASVYHYTVTGIEGNWNNLSTDGSITYRVALKEVSGDITFSKTGEQTKIHLQTGSNGAVELDLVFEISSVHPVQ
jgi:hypothetical protein